MKKALALIRVLFWLLVLVLSLFSVMMVAMDLMAAGMLAEACAAFYRLLKE